MKLELLECKHCVDAIAAQCFFVIEELDFINKIWRFLAEFDERFFLP